MRITQWGEYGIHCAVYIAEQHTKGITAVRAQEIAINQNIALDYAQQILQRLRRKKIIESVRGPQGGYKLSRSPQDISIYDIITASEGDTFEVICDTKPLDHMRCEPDSCCNLRSIWHGLKQHVNEYLLKFNLRDLMHQRDELVQVVERVV